MYKNITIYNQSLSGYEPNEPSKQLRDVIDVFSEGSQEWIEREDESGNKIKDLEIDPEKIYWSTKMVNSPFFGHYVMVLKGLEQKAHECDLHMSAQRAQAIKDGIIAMVKSHKYSIDAKASETFTKNKNVQGSFLHLVSRNKIEKQISVTGNKKQAFMNGLFGQAGEDEQD